MFGHPLLALAALDRLTHHAHLIEIKGSSYRQKQRQAQKAAKVKKPEEEK
ncbi:MAG: ATP-binding protein [Candidatus Omnitrophota bacterium]